MTGLTALYLKVLSTGRAPLFVRLTVLSLGLLGAFLSGDASSVFAGDEGGGDGGDPGGW